MLAHQADCIVVAVDYRLGARIQISCARGQIGEAALKWVALHAVEFGRAIPACIAVGGDSAGAENLATVNGDSGARCGASEAGVQLLIYLVPAPGTGNGVALQVQGGYVPTRNSITWFYRQTCAAARRE